MLGDYSINSAAQSGNMMVNPELRNVLGTESEKKPRFAYRKSKKKYHATNFCSALSLFCPWHASKSISYK